LALLNDAPGHEDWATTIRHIGEPTTNRRTKSTLVAISAVLDWRYDHLTNILHGEPQKNASSPLEPHFENLLRAEVGPVKEEIAGIRDIIHVIDKKIDVIIESQRSLNWENTLEMVSVSVSSRWFAGMGIDHAEAD
jgi:hypothetical protein